MHVRNNLPVNINIRRPFLGNSSLPSVVPGAIAACRVFLVDPKASDGGTAVVNSSRSTGFHVPLLATENPTSHFYHRAANLIGLGMHIKVDRGWMELARTCSVGLKKTNHPPSASLLQPWTLLLREGRNSCHDYNNLALTAVTTSAAATAGVKGVSSSE